ncbi:MAG: hypothetical protein OXT09_23310, partial [Myxococcales bacterium]|nr:hypothetical protein [Myxococcales bacterium]
MSRELPLLGCALLLACSSAPKGETSSSSHPPRHEGEARIELPGERTKKPQAEALPGEAPAPEVAAEQAPAAAPADVESALAYDPKDPLANLEAADALDTAGTIATDVKVPRGGCAVTQAGQRVWSHPGPATVVSLGRGFAVIGYAKKELRDQLFLVHVPASGLPEPITAIDIEPPHPRARIAPPGASARSDNDIMVAFTDGTGELFARQLRIGRGGMGPRLKLAKGVDTRFAPAVTHHEDSALVAYTLGTTPMEVHLAVIDDQGKLSASHDATPTSMGASAPTFIAGASPPSLLTIDARDGMSPIVRSDLDADLKPRPGEVAVPVGMVSSPAELAGASGSVGTYVGYTGLGSAATSAVGLVAIAPIAGTPEALVKG